LGDCSYCKVKFVKGQLFSYAEEKISKSIESDLQQGAKEIWLTSQDCASYNLENGKNQFPELLNKILSLKHNFKLRLGMMNPNHVYPIINELILKESPSQSIVAQAQKEGMVLMKQDGFLKALKGITTLEEVIRVTEAA